MIFFCGGFVPLCSAPDEFCSRFPQNFLFPVLFLGISEKTVQWTHACTTHDGLYPNWSNWVNPLDWCILSPRHSWWRCEQHHRIWGTLSHLIFVTNIPVLSCLCLSVHVSVPPLICLFYLVCGYYPHFLTLFPFLTACVTNGLYLLFLLCTITSMNPPLHPLLSLKRPYGYVSTFNHITGTLNDPFITSALPPGVLMQLRAMRSLAAWTISPGWRARRCGSPPSPTPLLSPLSRLDSGDVTPPSLPSCSGVTGKYKRLNSSDTFNPTPTPQPFTPFPFLENNAKCKVLMEKTTCYFSL